MSCYKSFEITLILKKKIILFLTRKREKTFEKKIEMRTKQLMTIILLIMVGNSIAGPAAFAICQAGCSALVVACYAGAGFTFGTITAGAGTPAAVLACNAAYGVCIKACFTALFAPTP